LVTEIEGGMLRVFEDRVLRRVFGFKRNEVTGTEGSCMLRS
jgi:hypothetical protein